MIWCLRLCDRYIIRDQEMCVLIEKEAKNALDALLKFSLYTQQQVDDINPSILFDLQKYHRPVWQMLDDFNRKEILMMVETNLNKGVKEGLYQRKFRCFSYIKTAY